MLTGIGRLFFRSPIGDFHCGLRGFDKQAIERLDLQSAGMEFASEMVVKATLARPAHHRSADDAVARTGASRPPHLRSWRDGWRHLRFLLMYSPRWLFLYPGLAMIVLGFAVLAWLLPGVRYVGGVALDIHTLVYASGLIMLGLQACLFSIFTKLFGMGQRLLPPDPLFERLIRAFTLERGLAIGAALVVGGAIGSVYAVVNWKGSAFGPQQPQELMRIVVPSLTAIMVGMEIVFASFFLSVLQLMRIPSVPAVAND